MKRIPLEKLDPKLNEKRLVLDCPKCGPSHVLLIPFLGPHNWNRSGSSVDDLTVSPSYRSLSECAVHFTVNFGMVEGKEGWT